MLDTEKYLEPSKEVQKALEIDVWTRFDWQAATLPEEIPVAVDRPGAARSSADVTFVAVRASACSVAERTGCHFYFVRHSCDPMPKQKIWQKALTTIGDIYHCEA